MGTNLVPYGMHVDMPFEQYAAIEALNYSTLKHLKKSPMQYRYHADHKQPPTAPMVLGSAVHRIILEPQRVGDFAVWDSGIRRGKAWDSFVAENQDSFILTKAERDHAVGMAAAVRRCPAAAEYLRAGDSEVSIVWKDKAIKRDFKGRIDRLTRYKDHPLIVDLKSTRDCSPFRFGNEAYRLGYHIQSAIYRDGYYYLTGDMPEVAIIAVENKAPYETAVFRVTDEVLQQGKDDYSQLVMSLLECEMLKRWPPAHEDEVDLTLPTYAYGEPEDDLSGLELVAVGEDDA